jgi:hypothetical protein
MSKRVFGIVMLFILSIALAVATGICYLSAEVYENNVLLIPEGDPDCVRFLPQISHLYNLSDPASFRVNQFNLFFQKIRFLFTLWEYSLRFMYLSYIVNLFLGLRVYLFLRKESLNISIEHNRIQRQITMTFILQGLVPFLGK